MTKKSIFVPPPGEYTFEQLIELEFEHRQSNGTKSPWFYHCYDKVEELLKLQNHVLKFEWFDSIGKVLIILFFLLFCGSAWRFQEYQEVSVDFSVLALLSALLFFIMRSELRKAENKVFQLERKMSENGIMVSFDSYTRPIGFKNVRLRVT